MSVEDRARALLEAGDVAAAAAECIRGFGPAILRYLRSLLRDEDDAMDAFSEFAENLWLGLARVRPRTSLRTWAFRIAWNAALSLRDEAWRRRVRRLESGEASALAEEVRTRTALRLDRQEQALERLRQALALEDQSLLALRLDQALSWSEIAEVLEQQGSRVESATLAKRYERIKERLRALAKAEGLVP
jgi:RNA polymerase sigma-70 factor (ECF subfamily)